MSNEYPLDGFALEIKVHWARYRPQMFRQLEAEGAISIRASTKRRSGPGRRSRTWWRNGLEPSSAWEAVREEWAFVPAESDQPEPMQELFPPEELAALYRLGEMPPR